VLDPAQSKSCHISISSLWSFSHVRFPVPQSAEAKAYHISISSFWSFSYFQFPVLGSAEGKSYHTILLSRFLVLSYCVETCSREIMPHFLHQLLVVCVFLVPVLESGKGISYHINVLAAFGYFPMLSYCAGTC
jgi:hypothetical protein